MMGQCLLLYPAGFPWVDRPDPVLAATDRLQGELRGVAMTESHTTFYPIVSFLN